MRFEAVLIAAAIIHSGSPVFAGEKTQAADEVSALREQVAVQQKEIERLRGAVDQLVHSGNAATAGTPYRIEPVSVARAASALEPNIIAAPKEQLDRDYVAPLSIRIGAADFTPGGFVDFTSVYRTTNVGSGIGTSFGSIPFSNSTAGKLSESRFSTQNSRFSLMVKANPGNQSVTGYVEADFLGYQPPNGLVTSNGVNLRMRQYWVDVKRGRWEVLGGQAWSLLTPNRTGVMPLPSDVFNTMDMDTNYQAGLVWSRDPGVRLIYHASPKWTAAVSLENPQQFDGSAVVLPSPFYANQVDNGGNLNTPNARPDVIAKLAYDGSMGGRGVHLEAAGMSRAFRVLREDGGIASASGGGGSVNANVEIVKNVRVIANTFYSSGGGRYIFGLGPDFVLRPDGTPSLVHSASAVAGIEYQSTPATTWYAYYGGAYFGRNYSLDAKGNYAGFGFPGSPASANRNLQEATVGMVRTFWKNPKYGALQLITQYSYLTRNPWSVPSGTPAQAHVSMVYADLRFVLP